MLRPLLLVLALTVAGPAASQADGQPERIARLAYVEGATTFQGAQDVAPTTLPERPLEAGDRISTARGGRAEVSLGSGTLRLDEDSAVIVVELDASAVRLKLTAGTASLHLRGLLEGESVEVDTLNTTVAFLAPGEYRLDITPSDATELTVRTGDAEVATAGGRVRVADGQRVRIEARAEFASLVTPRPADEFDDWVLEREVEFAESAPPEGEPGDYYADETLDDYGEWHDDPGYGRVWMPSYAYGGYDPFGYGHWRYNGFGYSWYDPMPWSPYTYHYGRWAYLDDLNRWAWVSRREQQRRVENRADQLDRELERRSQDARRNTAPMGRPAASSDAQRRARDASDELARRRVDADRRPVFQRPAETGKPARSSTSAAERNAAASQAVESRRSAPTTTGPAQSSSSSSQATQPAARPSRPSAPTTSRMKGSAKPQDP